MPFTESLSVFFATGDFGTAATFTHAGGSPSAVNVLFDASFMDPLGMEGSHPRAVGAASDFPSVAHDDTLVIGATTYKIKGVDPDGTGIVLLKLQQQ